MKPFLFRALAPIALLAAAMLTLLGGLVVATACHEAMARPGATPTTAAGTARPYDRSSYLFVSRSERRPRLSSFDDPRLRQPSRRDPPVLPQTT